MKTRFTHLLLPLFFLAINANAQDFKVIEETKDYILKEVDSAYYYTHGIEPKDDYEINSFNDNKKGNALKLPIENGKFIELRDSFNYQTYKGWDYYLWPQNGMSKYYLVRKGFGKSERTDLFLINKENGNIDTIDRMPVFSPNILFYCHCHYSIDVPYNHYLTVKNIKENKNYVVRIFNSEYNTTELPCKIKWVDNSSFIFNAYILNQRKDKRGVNKYYLFQIK